MLYELCVVDYFELDILVTDPLVAEIKALDDFQTAVCIFLFLPILLVHECYYNSLIRLYMGWSKELL